MPFKKGHKKIGGRVKGTPNKTSSQFRNKINEYVIENWESITNDVSEMSANNRLRFYMKLMDYVVPRLTSIGLGEGVDIDSLFEMSSQERKRRIERIKKELES